MDVELKEQIFKLAVDVILESLEYNKKNREFLVELADKVSSILARILEYNSYFEVERDFEEAVIEVGKKIAEMRPNDEDAFLEFVGYAYALNVWLYEIWSELNPPTYLI